jgi:hypothetical protein
MLPADAFDRHDLQRVALRVLTEIDDACRARRWTTGGRRLLESNAVVSDDMADALLGDPMLGCRACEMHVNCNYFSIFV